MRTSETYWLTISTHRERQTTVITQDSKSNSPYCTMMPPWEASERGHTEPKTHQVGRVDITSFRSDKKHCPLPHNIASRFLPISWLWTMPAGSADPHVKLVCRFYSAHLSTHPRDQHWLGIFHSHPCFSRGKRSASWHISLKLFPQAAVGSLGSLVIFWAL